MTDTPAALWVDGWELWDGVRVHLASYDGQRSVAALRGSNLELPAQHGTRFVPKHLSPGRCVCTLWITGETRADAEYLFNDIIAHCVRADRLVELLRQNADGTYDITYGQVTGTAITPTWVGQKAAQIVVDFEIPSGVWSSATAGAPAVESYTRVMAGTPNSTPTTVSVPFLAGSTAPITDVEITVAGQYTSWRISWGTGNYWTEYRGPATASQKVVFDDTGVSVSSGMDLSKFHYSGPRFLQILPAGDLTTPPSFQIIFTGIGANTYVMVRGSRQKLA